jgi:hypothetical protein
MEQPGLPPQEKGVLVLLFIYNIGLESTLVYWLWRVLPSH